MEYTPDHPRCGKGGALPQHRLVMECVLGRLLEPGEVVHHRDHRGTHNWPDNLALMPDRRSHGLEHANDTRRRFLAPIDEDSVRVALEGRSTAEAAALLGVSHNTLRLRYPDLLTKRRSPGAPLDPELTALLRQLATDPTISTSRAIRQLGVTAVTLRAWLRIAGIEWVRAPTGRPKSRRL